MNPSTQKQLIQKLSPKGALIVCVLVICAAVTALFINSRTNEDEKPRPTVQQQTGLRLGSFASADNANVSGVVGARNSNINVLSGSNSGNGVNSNNIINSNVDNSTKVDKSVRKVENKTYNQQVNQYNQHLYQQSRDSTPPSPAPRQTAPPVPEATPASGISRGRHDSKLQHLYGRLEKWGLKGEETIGRLSVGQCGAAYAEWERGCPVILQEINEHMRLTYGVVKFFDREFGTLPAVESSYGDPDEAFRQCKGIFHTRAETLRNFSALVEYELVKLRQ